MTEHVISSITYEDDKYLLKNAVLMSKTFENIIATANDVDNATFYFGKIVADSWDVPLRIRYRVKAYCQSNKNYNQYAYVSYFIIRNTATYCVENVIYSTSYRAAYYHNLYRATQAGSTGCGHLLGESIYASTNPLDTNLKRTFEFEILELDNCTFEFFDSPVLYKNAPGTGSTNYTGRSDYNFSGSGLYPDNNTVTQTRIESRLVADTNGVKQYSIMYETKDRKVESLTSGSGTGTTKAWNTNAKIPYPPRLFYYGGSSNIAAGSNIGTSATYLNISTIDMRYSDNITSSAGYTINKPLYLECDIDTNGYFTISESPYKQTFTSGKYYIFIGWVHTAVYTLSLFNAHAVYYYNGTNLIPYDKYTYATKDHSHDNATTSKAGFMSSTDKTKLNGIAEGATKTEASTTNGKIKINGTDTTVYTHPSYTAKSSGLYKVTVDATGHVSAATAVAKADITGLGIPGSDTTYSAGTGLSLSGTTFNHSNSVTAITTAGFYKLKYDAQGHITGTTAVAKADITALGIPGSDTNTTYTLSGAYGTGNDTWVTTLTPSSGTATTSTVPKGTTSAYGLMKLSDSTSSTSTALAATANAVKSAYDLANGKSTVSISRSLTSGTKIGTITIDGTETDLYCQTNTNTDTKVTQTATTTDANYEVLFSETADNTTRTEGARKSAGLKFNPNYKRLSFDAWEIPDITGSTTDLDSYTDASGNYKYRRVRCTTTGGGNNISNKPANSPFVLEIILIRWASATDYITKQIYHCYDKKTYQRFCTNGTWTDWAEIKITDTVYTHPSATAYTSGLYKVTVNATGHVTNATAVTKSDITGLGIPSSDTNTTYTLTQDATDGHKLTFTPSSGTATTITIPDNNTTYSAGTGLSLSGTTFNHSNSITAVTTAAFKKFKYDAQGHITGTADVAASDLPSHTHDAFTGATSSADGTKGMVPAPTKANYNTKYLRADGTWQVPPNDNTDTKVASVVTNPAENTGYYIHFSSGNTTANTLMHNVGLKYSTYEGTTSAIGKARIVLGTDIKKGTVGNKTGSLYINFTNNNPNEANEIIIANNVDKPSAQPIVNVYPNAVNNAGLGVAFGSKGLTAIAGGEAAVNYFALPILGSTAYYYSGGKMYTDSAKTTVATTYNQFIYKDTSTSKYYQSNGTTVTEITAPTDYRTEKNDTERLLLMADADIIMYTNCNTIADRKSITINTAGNLSMNGNITSYGDITGKNLFANDNNNGDVTISLSRPGARSYQFKNSSGILSLSTDYTYNTTSKTWVKDTAYNTQVMSIDVPSKYVKPEITLNGFIHTAGIGSSWWDGRDHAVLALTTAASNYRPLISTATSGDGSWEIGNHNTENLLFTYISSAQYAAKVNPSSLVQIIFNNDGSIRAKNESDGFIIGGAADRLVYYAGSGPRLIGGTTPYAMGLVYRKNGSSDTTGFIGGYGDGNNPVSYFSIGKTYDNYAMRIENDLTGKVSVRGTNPQIKFIQTTTDKTYDNNSAGIIAHPGPDVYGMFMTIQSGGPMLIGAGECPNTLYGCVTSADHNPYGTVADYGEHMYISSDGNIVFVTGANGLSTTAYTDWTDLKTIYITNNGVLRPSITNKGGLGSSTIHWGNSYIDDMHAQSLAVENNTGDVKVSVKRTDTGVGADLLVGTGGENHGVYSRSNAKWIIYQNNASNTYVHTSLYNASETVVENLGIPFFDATVSTGYKGIRNNNGLRYSTLEGTTTSLGIARLVLGNGTGSGTANNKRGSIRLFSEGTNGIDIIPENTNSLKSITIPPSNGQFFIDKKNYHIDESSDTASYPWYKMGSLGFTLGNRDRDLVFLVTSAYSSRAIGILKAHARSTQAGGVYDSGHLVWLTAASAINVENFVMVYKNNSPASGTLTIELWCKNTQQYNGYFFKLLEEHSRGDHTYQWTPSTNVTGHGSATYDAGNGHVVSSYASATVTTNAGFYYVKGTQTASTNAWTGYIPVESLYEGLTIAYYLPYAGTSSSATLNLTLSNGNTTGAVAVYYTATSRATTHYGVGSTIYLTYYPANTISTNGNLITSASWRRCNYYSNNTTNQTLLTTNTNRPLLMASADNTNTTSTNNAATYRNNQIFANPSTGTITSNALVLGSPYSVDAAGRKGSLTIHAGGNETLPSVTFKVDEIPSVGNKQITIPAKDGVMALGKILFDDYNYTSNTVTLTDSVSSYTFLTVGFKGHNGIVMFGQCLGQSGVYGIPLMWGAQPTQGGGACNFTSGFIQISADGKTISVGAKDRYATMGTSSFTFTASTSDDFRIVFIYGYR